jgi:hypothetical protein
MARRTDNWRPKNRRMLADLNEAAGAADACGVIA